MSVFRWCSVSGSTQSWYSGESRHKHIWYLILRLSVYKLQVSFQSHNRINIPSNTEFLYSVIPETIHRQCNICNLFTTWTLITTDAGLWCVSAVEIVEMGRIIIQIPLNSISECLSHLLRIVEHLANFSAHFTTTRIDSSVSNQTFTLYDICFHRISGLLSDIRT